MVVKTPIVIDTNIVLDLLVFNDMGFALPSAIALSMMLFARPIIVQPDSMSPAPWRRYRTGKLLPFS